MRRDYFSGLLGISKIDKILNARVIESCGGGKQGRDEMIYESILRLFAETERMEKRMNTKRIYEVECIGSRSVSLLRK